MTTRVVLLFCMVIDSFAGYAQSQTITLEMRKATLLQVIEKIEEISDYTFLYSDAHVRNIGGLDLDFKEAGIEQVLSHCLADTKLTYHIEDKTIILIPGEEKRTFVEIQDDPVFLLHGRVEDSRGREMPGANIYIRNQPGLGKASDEHGNFSLYVRRGDVVVVSSVGYRTEKRTVKDFSEFLHVVLKESMEEMDEIQVVGYGIQRKVSHVGAVSNMALEKYGFPVTSFSNAIAGALSGIIGVQRSGEPGEDVSEFWVRGVSTFGAGEKALILIDGVERTTFNDLVPEDIGSFSVLKDATATAVYGARGANGVLLLRTKRGQAGRMRVMANAKLMMSCLPRLPDYLRAYDYALLANEAHKVRGGKAPVQSGSSANHPQRTGPRFVSRRRLAAGVAEEMDLGSAAQPELFRGRRHCPLLHQRKLSHQRCGLPRIRPFLLSFQCTPPPIRFPHQPRYEHHAFYGASRGFRHPRRHHEPSRHREDRPSLANPDRFESLRYSPALFQRASALLRSGQSGFARGAAQRNRICFGVPQYGRDQAGADAGPIATAAGMEGIGFGGLRPA